MERERRSAEIQKNEILNKSPLLNFFLSDDFTLDREAWDEDIQEHINRIHSEIRIHHGKELDPDIISSYASAWKTHKFDNGLINDEYVHTTFESVLLSGYEVGSGSELSLFEEDIINALIQNGIFHFDDERHNNFKGAKL